jgi:hypothetical protein
MEQQQQQQKPRGRPFAKGQSGNPKGRERGSRNRATQAMQLLLDGEEPLTRNAVDFALDGDTTALRLCLDRLMPPRRGHLAPIALMQAHNAGDLTEAMAAIIAARLRRARVWCGSSGAPRTACVSSFGRPAVLAPLPPGSSLRVRRDA